jgi:hypothetical protein
LFRAKEQGRNGIETQTKSHKGEMLTAFFDTKAQWLKDTKFFYKKKMLINGKYFKPFERIEPIERIEPQHLKPLERVEDFQPLQPLKPLKLHKRLKPLQPLQHLHPFHLHPFVGMNF